MPAVDADTLAHIFREESGASIATLVRLFGDIDLAEEMAQEAFVVASERWPATGLPTNPGGWLTTTARNRAIHRLRRESSRHDRHAQAALLQTCDQPVEPASDMTDDRLRLIFTCCHPRWHPARHRAHTATARGSRNARHRGARSRFRRNDGQAARTRKKIRDLRIIPYRVPRDAELPATPLGADGSLSHLQRGLRRNEQRSVDPGRALRRSDSARGSSPRSCPTSPKSSDCWPATPRRGTTAGRELAADGALVLLADQDRTLWNREPISEGQAIVRQLLQRNTPGPYQIQAAIQAVHSDAATADTTDWPRSFCSSTTNS